MYYPNNSQGNGTGQGMAMSQATGNGLCGKQQDQTAADYNVISNTPEYQKAMEERGKQAMDRMVYTPVGAASTPGNVPGTLPNTPSPLTAAAPQNMALASLAPRPDAATAINNAASRYQQQPTQGNAAGQGAAAKILTGLCA